MEWQLVDKDNWIFGEKIRGIVRDKKAEIYINESYNGKEGGWFWRVFGDKATGGVTYSRNQAIWVCEVALGITQKE
jgi:hypothetical protein